MKRSVTDWEAAVCKHRGLPARAGMIALWLARRMNENRIVSVSEEAILEAFGISANSRDTVVRAIRKLKEEGLLDSVVVGRKGMTAVYQGIFPSAQRLQDVVAEKYVHQGRNVGAMDGLSDYETYASRTKEELDKASDTPPASQEQGLDDDEDLSWIDAAFDDQECVSVRGAERPSPPQAQTIASPIVKAALDDWSGTTERQPVVDNGEAKSKRSGGRAA